MPAFKPRFFSLTQSNMSRFCRLAVLLIWLAGVPAAADIIEMGDLTIIDDPGNPSHGLEFLDMSFSVGLNAADALANARLTYPAARFARPSEWDDLFDAVGITYTGAETISAAWETGPTLLSMVDNNPGVTTLVDALGATNVIAGGRRIVVFTDPDNDTDPATTRDYFNILANDWPSASLRDDVTINNNTGLPPLSAAGFGIVTPEPSSLALVGVAAVGVGLVHRRKRRAAKSQTE